MQKSIRETDHKREKVSFFFLKEQYGTLCPKLITTNALYKNGYKKATVPCFELISSWNVWDMEHTVFTKEAIFFNIFFKCFGIAVEVTLLICRNFKLFP